MATKAKTKSKAVVVAPPRAVSTGGWREKAAQSIQNSKAAIAKLPQMSGNFISFRGGQIALGGNQLQNPLPVVLLDYGYERTYYSKQYQPDVLTTPDCYSFDGVVPHEKAKVPQNDNCEQCRWNQFGSAVNGRGKACKEGARMVLLHADALKDIETIANAPLLQARASVLNSKAFRSYIENYFGADDRPSWTAVTTIQCVPDSKSQYALSFMPSVLNDPSDDIFDAIAARVDEAAKLLTQPYPEIEDAPAPKPAPAQAARRPRKF